MKRFFLLTVGAALCAQLAIANAPATPLKGCAAKVANIQKELAIAKSKEQTRKVRGLEDALRAAEKCDDSTLLAEREKKVREAANKVSEREAELKEDEREGKSKDIAKARRKLAEAQQEMTAAKAEVLR